MFALHLDAFPYLEVVRPPPDPVVVVVVVVVDGEP